MPLLELHGVHAGYDGASALSEAELEVRPREVVAILGSNGAGKSTLLKAVAGLVAARSGRISFDGQPVENLPAHVLARRGLVLVPEGRRLFPEMTVLENLRTGTFAAPTRNSAAILDSVFSLFPALAGKRSQVAATLSGGEQQMLALGRGLMAQPRLLLVDEPSLGLAPRLARELFQAIAVLAEGGMSIMLAEQNLYAALRVANRAYVLRTGRVVLQGSSAELRARSDLPELYWGDLAGRRRPS